MKKLYRVEVTGEIFVLADDKEAAVFEGRFADQDAFNYDASEVSNIDEVEDAWQDSYPFGGNGDLTCRQIITGGQGGT
jgi:hypothetical protein